MDGGRPVFPECVLLTLAALIKCNNLVALIKCNSFSGTQTATNPNRQFLFSGRNCDGNVTAQGLNATFCHLDDDESEGLKWETMAETLQVYTCHTAHCTHVTQPIVHMSHSPLYTHVTHPNPFRLLEFPGVCFKKTIISTIMLSSGSKRS